MSNSQPATLTNGKKEDNGRDLHKHLPTVAIALVAAIPGLGAFFRDVPTRQELHAYVREHAPYTRDKELIMQTLTRVETQNEEARLTSREFNSNLIKLTTKMEMLNESIGQLRGDLQERK